MKALSLLSALALAVCLAACGGGNDNGTTSGGGSTGGSATTPTATKTTSNAGGGGGSTLQLAADASALKFDKSSLTAKAGQVTIDFTNPSAIGHDVVIEAAGDKELAKTAVISQSKATLTANLKPGTYTFYCSVPGHEDAGMKGTLTVK